MNIKLDLVFASVIMMFLIFQNVYCQNFERLQVPIYQADKELKLSNTGGLRAGQFSNIDFNGDGKNDLFVFDRNGDQVLPFVKTGEVESLDYRFAPEYIPIFPPLRNWALLIDFNKDSVLDIFTASSKYPGCIEVWRGKKDQSGRITYKLITFNYGLPEILQFPISNNYTQIYVSSIDLPAIADVDNDGDMDIISFEADGSYASFYRNTSVEEKLGLDSLKYVRHDICWGKFAENQFNEKITLSANAFSCSSGLTTVTTGLRHSGSSITVFDNDGDGDMDIILGDIGSPKSTRLINGGTQENAYMTKLESNFPENDVPVNLDYFVGAYYVDVDADGKRDLIVTPNEMNSAESENHVWLYKNVGSDNAPIFRFLKNNFLVEEMAYFNSASHPAFGDINGDGLQDIIMGTGGIQLKNGIKKNRMLLLLNTGTNKNPAYTITDEDYLQFSKYGEQTGRFAPALGDIDNDGDEDLIVGDARGQLYFALNIAGKGKPMVFNTPTYFYSEIFVGQNAKPQIIDLDGDGLKDIVVGEKNNEFNFFKNIGTAALPKFNSEAETLPNTRQAGKLFAGNNFETQNGAPYFFISTNKLHMMMGTEDAGFITYHDIEGNLYSGFKKLSEMTGNIKQGRKVTSSLADIDGDGFLEMAVGNERGGLVFYNTTFKSDTVSSTQVTDLDLNIKIFPNPSFDYIFVKSDLNISEVVLYSTSGVKITDIKVNAPNEITNLPQGVYFLKIYFAGTSVTKKLIKY